MAYGQAGYYRDPNYFGGPMPGMIPHFWPVPYPQATFSSDTSGNQSLPRLHPHPPLPVLERGVGVEAGKALVPLVSEEKVLGVGDWPKVRNHAWHRSPK